MYFLIQKFLEKIKMLVFMVAVLQVPLQSEISSIATFKSMIPTSKNFLLKKKLPSPELLKNIPTRIGHGLHVKKNQLMRFFLLSTLVGTPVSGALYFKEYAKINILPNPEFIEQEIIPWLKRDFQSYSFHIPEEVTIPGDEYISLLKHGKRQGLGVMLDERQPGDRSRKPFFIKSEENDPFHKLHPDSNNLVIENFAMLSGQERVNAVLTLFKRCLMNDDFLNAFWRIHFSSFEMGYPFYDVDIIYEEHSDLGYLLGLVRLENGKYKGINLWGKLLNLFKYDAEIDLIHSIDFFYPNWIWKALKFFLKKKEVSQEYDFNKEAIKLVGQDDYAILGLERDADVSAVKKAYREKVLLYHPDKNPARDANEKFKKINAAYKRIMRTFQTPVPVEQSPRMEPLLIKNN